MWATPSLGLTITSPSVFNNQAYVSVQVSSSQSVVFALNASTGAILGTTPAVPGTFTPPVVEFGRIYVGDSNPSPDILAFSAGAPYTVLWTATTGGFGVVGKPAVDQGQLYAVGGNGTLYAFNASTGAFNWSSVGPCGPLYKAASPTLANGGVYAGGSGCVQAFKAIGGGATWTVSVGGLVTSPATIVNGALYVATTAGSSDSIFSY
jgi:outer membrane protein assembly factor BamB